MCGHHQKSSHHTSTWMRSTQYLAARQLQIGDTTHQSSVRKNTLGFITVVTYHNTVNFLQIPAFEIQFLAFFGIPITLGLSLINKLLFIVLFLQQMRQITCIPIFSSKQMKSFRTSIVVIFLWVFPRCTLTLHDKGSDSDSFLTRRAKFATAGFITASLNGQDVGIYQTMLSCPDHNSRHILHTLSQVNFRGVEEPFFRSP